MNSLAYALTGIETRFEQAFAWTLRIDVKNNKMRATISNHRTLNYTDGRLAGTSDIYNLDLLRLLSNQAVLYLRGFENWIQMHFQDEW
jgi:hypothetical protein